MGHKKKKLKMKLIKVGIITTVDDDDKKGVKKQAVEQLAEYLLDKGLVIIGKTEMRLGFVEINASIYVAKPI